MSIQIKETFRVAAPADEVWGLLKAPPRVVHCLPGAELTEAVDDRTFRGRAKVKVGPITTSYAGTARLESVDDTARRMRLTGDGAEAGGAGSARLTMSGEVTPVDGGSEVHVDATIEIAGRVMQYGRGLVEAVSRQLFKQFAAAVRQELEAPAAARGEGPDAAGPETRDRSPSVPADSPSTSPAAPPAPAIARPAKRELHLFSLLLAVLADWLRRLFRRAPATK